MGFDRSTPAISRASAALHQLLAGERVVADMEVVCCPVQPFEVDLGHKSSQQEALRLGPIVLGDSSLNHPANLANS